MADSLIRTRQLNQGDLSGFLGRALFPIISGTGIVLNSGVFPTVSGTENIGSQSLPFNQVYTNQLRLAYNSGIYFGDTYFNAYTTGTTGYIQIGSYTISTSPTGLTIIGPSGGQGLQGVIGPSGLSGLSVTGAVSVNQTGFRLQFSNGTSGNSLALPSGSTGSSGVGVTGFTVNSGIYLQALFNNGTKSTGLLLPSGARGLAGKVGGIVLDISDFTGFYSGEIAPKAYIYDIDSAGFTSNPNLNLIRGMTYDFGYSGLNLSQITITGNGIDYPTGSGIRTNYFTESGITGYLKFCFFDSTITGLYNNPRTGRYIRQDLGGSGVYADILAKVKSTEVAYNITEQGTRAQTVFTTKLSAGASYKYGFQKYNFYNQEAIDDLGAWGFYVLGNANISHFGPTGQPGSQGFQGIPGTQGDRGFKGVDGAQGTSVVSVVRSGNAIAFQLSNSNYTAYLDLPSGGPTGSQGSQGTQGTQGASGGQGIQGVQGATGFADKYASSFYYNDTYINATGAALYKRTSGTSNWLLATGTGRRFSAGDEIQFYNDSLVLKAYSTWQKVIFADSPYTRGQYFYATVSSFNPSNGLLSFVVADSPAPLGTVLGQIQFDSYNLINLNLGGLGSSGAMGISGAVGTQGIKGDTGNPIFVINNPMSGLVAGTNTLRFNQYDVLNLYITGHSNILNLDYTTISTGQTLMLRIYNSGSAENVNTQISPLIIWDSYIEWPYSVSSPMSNPNQSSLYTLLRFPNQNNNPVVFGTYSMGYSI